MAEVLPFHVEPQPVSLTITPSPTATDCEGHALLEQADKNTAAAAHDNVWALKRDWTDVDFQKGANANRTQLQEFEDILVSRLRVSCSRVLGVQAAPDLHGAATTGDVLARVLEPAIASCAAGESPPEHVRVAVLNDPEVLGSALDIVGAYLKNYEVDKASQVCATVLPACRARGGLWLLKALNHIATVRMKQARPVEALTALRETEAMAKGALSDQAEQDEAWEFWETVYRNFAWVLSSLDRRTEAMEYAQLAIDVKARVGRPASWFDLWDIGRMGATGALARDNSKDILASQATVTKALWLHRDAEPGDLVMRAKIWHSVGECSFALGHLAEKRGPSGSKSAASNSKAAGTEALGHYRKALKCFRESHKLFQKTEGRFNPLTGGEAEAVAWSMLKVGADEEAKEYLLCALEASSRQQNNWGDGGRLDAKAPALQHAMQTVDRILEVHRRTDDRDGLMRYFDAIERLCENVCGRLTLSKERTDAAIYERLVSSASMIMVASGAPDGTSRSQQLLRGYLWDRPETMQAQICSTMLNSIRDVEDGTAAGDNDERCDAGAPAIEALARALAGSVGPTH